MTSKDQKFVIPRQGVRQQPGRRTRPRVAPKPQAAPLQEATESKSSAPPLAARPASADAWKFEQAGAHDERDDRPAHELRAVGGNDIEGQTDDEHELVAREPDADVRGSLFGNESVENASDERFDDDAVEEGDQDDMLASHGRSDEAPAAFDPDEMDDDAEGEAEMLGDEPAEFGSEDVSARSADDDEEESDEETPGNVLDRPRPQRQPPASQSRRSDSQDRRGPGKRQGGGRQEARSDRPQQNRSSGAGRGDDARRDSRREPAPSRSATNSRSGGAAPSPREMLINVAEGEECRIAVVQNGKLEELYMERASSTSHVGNIYKGRVTNVEPSIQAAFVDFGLGRNGFLHISDLLPTYFGRAGEDITEYVGRKMARHERPPIQRCLRRGDEIIVQVIKEGIGTKGPTLSSYVSIPGRYLVMMPGMSSKGVSRKIEDEVERRRLRQILDQLQPPDDCGFILRTAGVGKSRQEIERDLTYLTRLWETIKRKRDNNPAPVELYAESDLVIRTVRDVFTSDITRIIVDNADVENDITDFFRVAMPRTKDMVELYQDTVPLFHKYGIEKEIEQMYSRHVPLASGGSLVIDSTEAIVAIDVNSGKFRDHSDAEMTAFKTDMEAADEIARQLRLRDLGGVIICDFIDLRYERHRRELEERLHENLRNDRAKTKMLRMSQFGIVELTRQRMRPSLKRSVYFDCPHCKGAGLVKTPESMGLDVMRRLAIAASDSRVTRVNLTVCAEVSLVLSNRKRSQISALETRTGKPISIQPDAALGADEIRLELFDARDGLVFLEDLGMTPGGAQPAQRAPLPVGRSAGQSGRGQQSRAVQKSSQPGEQARGSEGRRDQRERSERGDGADGRQPRETSQRGPAGRQNQPQGRQNQPPARPSQAQGGDNRRRDGAQGARVEQGRDQRDQRNRQQTPARQSAGQDPRQARDAQKQNRDVQPQQRGQQRGAPEVPDTRDPIDRALDRELDRADEMYEMDRVDEQVDAHEAEMRQEAADIEAPIMPANRSPSQPVALRGRDEPADVDAEEVHEMADHDAIEENEGQRRRRRRGRRGRGRGRGNNEPTADSPRQGAQHAGDRDEPRDPEQDAQGKSASDLGDDPSPQSRAESAIRPARPANLAARQADEAVDPGTEAPSEDSATPARKRGGRGTSKTSTSRPNRPAKAIAKSPAKPATKAPAKPRAPRSGTRSRAKGTTPDTDSAG